MRSVLWIVLVLILAFWPVGFLFDIGGRSVHALLGVVILLLCYSLITRRGSRA